MGIVLEIHSFWRWVVVLIAIVALVKWGIGWLSAKKPDLWDRRLTTIFTSVLDVQVLLGIGVLVLLIAAGSVPRDALEHVGTMVVAVIVAHLMAIWRKRDDNTVLRNNVLDLLVVIILIVLGVSRVGGWGVG